MITDFNERVARARALGSSREAIAQWRDLLTVYGVQEPDFRRCCVSLAELYLRPETLRVRAAAAIKEYLRDLEGAAALFSQVGSPRDMARLWSLRGDHLAASRAYQSVSMIAHAALEAELGRSHDQARALWLQLIRPADAAGDRYVGALARFNGGRNDLALGRREAAHALFYEAMDLLGQEADRREGERDLEGAFRCFQVMANVGRTAGAFEDLAEGYLNCMRLLKQRSDRFGTVQWMCELVRVAEEQGELHAAAELYREAGDYARRMGFVYADYFLAASGAVWKRIALEGAKEGRQQGLIENALLAAVDAFSRVVAVDEVAVCYDALSTLDLGPQRKSRYAALATELRAAAAARAEDPTTKPKLPEFFRRPLVHGEHWVRDLVDREAGVNVSQVASRLLANPAVSEGTRRRALNIFLAHDDHVLSRGEEAALPRPLVLLLGEAQHPSFVPPLVEVYRRGGVEQKCAVVQAAARMKLLKEGAQIVDMALEQDRGGEVYAEALKALRGIDYVGALDSLIRMFSNHEEREIREVALRNIAIIGTNEAAEFLLDVIRANVAGMGALAKEALVTRASDKMLPALDANRRQEPDAALRQFISGLAAKVRNRGGFTSP